MNYPTEFKERVKSEYGDIFNLYDRLEKGDVFVGRILDDSCCYGISEDEILNLGHEELKRKAKKLLKRKQLYREWSCIYQKQLERNNK